MFEWFFGVTRKPQNTKATFFRTLGGNLFELLLIFTIVAAVYVAAATYLRANAETDLRFSDLKQWDDRLLYAHEFLKGLKFSAAQTALICVVFMVFRRLPGGAARVSDAALKIFRSVTKQITRACLVALFAASFTFLGSNEKGVAQQIQATVRDFEATYTTYQSTVERNLQLVVKRELISRVWAEWNPGKRETVQRSFVFRRRARNLYGDYIQLQKLFKAGDADTGEALARLAEPLTATIQTEDGNPQPGARAPIAELEGVTLDALKSANSAAEKTLKQTQEEEVTEPTKTMEEEFGGSVLDVGFEQAKSLAPILEDIDAHFPGAGELLGAVWDAANETFLSKLKEAQKKALREGLISRGEGLKDMIMKVATALSGEATVGRGPTKAATIKPLGRLDERRLANLEQTLRYEAHQAEVKELAECRQRLKHKAGQLNELHAKLGVDAAKSAAARVDERGEGPPEIEARYVSSEGSRRNFVGRSKLFDDVGLNRKLLSRYALEEQYNKRIAEIIGQVGATQEEVVREILGAELEDYRLMYNGRADAIGSDRGFEREGSGIGGEHYRGALKEMGRDTPHEIPREIPRVIP